MLQENISSFFGHLCSQSHVVHKKLEGKLSFLEFNLQLITDIFSKYSSSTEKHTFLGRPSTTLSPSRLTGYHVLEDVSVNEKEQPKPRTSVVCNAQKNTNWTPLQGMPSPSMRYKML